MATSGNIPVVLVHGWGGSFNNTWHKPGIDALLIDGGRRVIGLDLLGHGSSDKPHDPLAYSNLHEWFLGALPADEPVVDVVAFSLGALTVLRALIAAPHRFGRVVLAGIGDGVFEPHDPTASKQIVAALQGTAPPDDNIARLFGQYAAQPGNDVGALIAIMQRPESQPLQVQDLSTINNNVLVAIGDKDFAAPATRLAQSFPNGSLAILKNTDHFATPGAFSFIDALLDFLPSEKL
ncbi:MAG: alpha/beta fold hydrolase [Ilumatobacteraceae bacterium]|nr:alpha/beta fold hydrolase [Ilumatobacteraceae bacterium]